MLLEARRKLVRMEGGVGWGGFLQPQLLGRNTARVGEKDAVGGNYGNDYRDHSKHQHRDRLLCV